MRAATENITLRGGRIRDITALLDVRAMKAKNVLVTGRPGVGKTTAVLKAVEELRRSGYAVGGFVTREVRVEGRREGFIMVDLAKGEQAYLARVGEGRPRVGRYVVFIHELERLGVPAILNAIEQADIVVVDEIGPMELLSQKFKRAVLKALESSKPVLATIHYRAGESDFGKAVLGRGDCRVVTVTEANRERAARDIAKLVLEALASAKDKTT